MSECIGNTIEEQNKCKYYKKATHRQRCMHKVFSTYCDCLDAQMDAEKSLEEKNQEKIDEMKESEVGKTS